MLPLIVAFALALAPAAQADHGQTMTLRDHQLLIYSPPGQVASTLQTLKGMGMAQLQFEPQGADTWTTIITVRPSNPEGYFTTRVSLPSAGGLRLNWTDPAGQPFYSRTAQVS